MPVPQMECPCERPRAGGQAGRQSWLTLNPALVVRAPTLAAQSGQNKQIKFWFLVFCFFLSFPPGNALDVSFILQAVL